MPDVVKFCTKHPLLVVRGIIRIAAFLVWEHPRSTPKTTQASISYYRTEE